MKYIGQQVTYKDPITGSSVTVIPGEKYYIELQYDGPQVIVNGQPLVDPNGTVWAVFNNGVKVPYAPHVLHNFWSEND